MGGMKISALDFARLLPAFMQDDEAAIALSKAINELIGVPGKRLHTIRAWDKIDELNEAECDELAWELDIDWYDSVGMSLDDKRATIKLALQIKRKRGTKWAVERLISAYFGEGYVMEWFDLENGKPYTLIALTTNTHITAENFDKFVDAVKAAKNERSHILGVFYFWKQDHPGVECSFSTDFDRYLFTKCGTKPRTATLGMIAKSGIETEPEESLCLYGFKKSGELKCGTYPRAATLGASINHAVETEPSLAFSAYSFAKCGTKIRTATLGVSTGQAAEAAPSLAFSAYSFIKCGTRHCGE